MKAAIFVMFSGMIFISLNSSAQYFNNISDHGRVSVPTLGQAQIQNLENVQAKIFTYNYGMGSPDQYRTVGSYQVKGNSYVLAGLNQVDIYSTEGLAKNLSVLYDSYDQQFGVIQNEAGKILFLDMSRVDSFKVLSDSIGTVKPNATFINAGKFNKSNNFYVQQLFRGEDYSLYKSYKAVMKSATADIAQSTLKEFEIQVSYYYTKGADLSKLKKVRLTSGNLTSVFKEEKDAVAKLDAETFRNNPEESAIKFFSEL